ncbi:MAG: winged helix-turn-helix transcriptional regulator [Actinobacteria bacterium]|nr:MAG: winged helix-turn-helix transcriptional regulator [Actinomycetota bacterium]
MPNYGMRSSDPLASTASLIADPSRASMLVVLAEAGPLAVSDLAAVARVTAQTASEHLARLAEGGLVVRQQTSRFHRYGLAHPGVSEALVALRKLTAPVDSTAALAAAPRAPFAAELAARSCYDHLAGRLGVEVTDALVRDRLIRRESWNPGPTRSGSYRLTKNGIEFLDSLGIVSAELRSLRRSFAHPCMDRTERRPHLGGALGAAIATRLMELRWIERLPEGRAVRITKAGGAGLRERFGIDP